MPITSTATTNWNGTLADGSGTTRLASSHAATFPVDWRARSEGSGGITTPEELLAASHASCFAMAFSHALSELGHDPGSVDVQVAVAFQPGKGVLQSTITLNLSGSNVPPEEFAVIAEDAKANCPISQALSIPILLEATLT